MNSRTRDIGFLRLDGHCFQGASRAHPSAFDFRDLGLELRLKFFELMLNGIGVLFCSSDIR